LNDVSGQQHCIRLHAAWRISAAGMAS
jgi:hypothetical protein